MGLFHLSPIALFFALVIGHCLGDYPLQGDFLAKAKNHAVRLHGVPWYQALTAHAVIQAGIVWILTGSAELALLEFVCHWCIDRWKSEATRPMHPLVTSWEECTRNERMFDIDQLLHIVCKAAWVWILVAILTR